MGEKNLKLVIQSQLALIIVLTGNIQINNVFMYLAPHTIHIHVCMHVYICLHTHNNLKNRDHEFERRQRKGLEGGKGRETINVFIFSFQKIKIILKNASTY